MQASALIKKIDFERIIERRRSWVLEFGKTFLDLWEGEGHEKDRLYDLFVVYPDPKNRIELFSVICPLCGWHSRLLTLPNLEHPRLAYFNTVAKVLAGHAYRKHQWKTKYNKFPVRIVNRWGELTNLETIYVCKRCNKRLPNFLLTIFHEILEHEA